MQLNQAINLISRGVPQELAIWADIGAGTGLFTLALEQLLEKGSTIFAIDKSPHALYRSPLSRKQNVVIEEGDFHKTLPLPEVDGILMANTLHYAKEPLSVLKNLLQYLKKNGTFLLVEYELEKPIPTWVPYPIPFHSFSLLASEAGLAPPQELNRTPSAYGHQYIYAASSTKL